MNQNMPANAQAADQVVERIDDWLEDIYDHWWDHEPDLELVKEVPGQTIDTSDSVEPQTSWTAASVTAWLDALAPETADAFRLNGHVSQTPVPSRDSVPALQTPLAATASEAPTDPNSPSHDNDFEPWAGTQSTAQEATKVVSDDSVKTEEVAVMLISERNARGIDEVTNYTFYTKDELVSFGVGQSFAASYAERSYFRPLRPDGKNLAVGAVTELLAKHGVKTKGINLKPIVVTRGGKRLLVFSGTDTNGNTRTILLSRLLDGSDRVIGAQVFKNLETFKKHFNTAEVAISAAEALLIAEGAVSPSHIPRVRGTRLPAGIASAPKRLAQGSSNLDVLYRKAATAHKELQALSSRLAGEFGGTAIHAPLKTRARALAKIASDYDGDASRILDLSRGAIVFNDLPSLNRALAKLSESGSVIRIKNRFASPTAEGYRDILINIRTSNDHIVELQLWHRGVMNVRIGRGHEIYEVIQRLQRTNPTSPLIQQLQEESRALYDGALGE